jgi:hypothetical protein
MFNDRLKGNTGEILFEKQGLDFRVNKENIKYPIGLNEMGVICL